MVDINKMTDAQFGKLVKPLWDYLVVSQTPQPADVIFVFGHYDTNLPKYATKLWLDGLAPIVLATGCINKKTGSSIAESEVYAEIMKSDGVDDKAILVETKATNVGENVRFGMRKLIDDGKQPKKVLLVGVPFGMRRFQATFQKEFPDVVTTACPPDAGMLDYVRYDKEKYALRLAAEIDRLVDYYDLGYIAKVDIPDEILDLSEKIKSLANKGRTF